MKQTCLIIDACQFTPNYNYSLLDALARRGEKVVYATTKFAHGYIPDPQGVKILRCFFFLARLVSRVTSSRSVRRLLRAVEYPANLIFLLAYVLIRRIAVVHFMWVTSPWLDYGVIRLLKLIGCRVVYTAHNPLPHERKASDIRKYSRIYQSVDHVIALVDYTRKEVVRNFGAPFEKISVIPHGDYERLFSQYGCNENLAQKVRKKAAGRRIITFLGSIRPYKGLEVFVEAFPLIKRRVSGPFFLVAGSLLIGDKQELERGLGQSCSPDDLWADIRFLPTEDMKAYLSVTDILVQPYIGASQSGNTVMAYSAGIPVISTNVGGLGEMIEDGTTGYVIAPGDPGALADAVAKCFEHDNYAKMSRNARQAATGQYSWERIAEQTAAVYRRLGDIAEC